MKPEPVPPPNEWKIRKPYREKFGNSASTHFLHSSHLQASAIVCQLPDPVQDQVHDLLAHSVVASGIVVCSIFFARDQLLRVE